LKGEIVMNGRRENVTISREEDQRGLKSSSPSL